MKTQTAFLSLIVCCLFSFNAMSAESDGGRSVSRPSTAKSAGSQGVVAGLVYSNLSDQRSKYSSEQFVNGERIFGENGTEKSGIHAGLYGIHLGYKDIYAFGTFGFSAGAQILRGLNRSEISSKINIYKILGDVVLPLNDVFSISGGLNISYISGAEVDDAKVIPGAGLQAGVEARFSEISLLLGAQVIGSTVEYDFSESAQGYNYRSKSKIESLHSGVITQISYTF